MITKDNGNNYSELCAEATKILKEYNSGVLGNDDSLDDINDYFTVLEDLKDLVVEKKADPYFLILPGITDEEPFEINANTRTIKIPDAFKNGIGVQGDHFAEVIYFSIDRYFDATDLFEQEAFIQWEAPAQGVNQKDTGLTLAINKTVNLIPGKVVFGWPISENITKIPGNLKFSVRFFTREQDEKDSSKFTLKYNFSTLTATIKINPGLDFDLSDDAYYQALLEDNTDAVMALYKNSSSYGLDYPASIPIFESSFYNPLIGNYDLIDLAKDLNTRAKFDKKEDTNSFGTISYKWYHSVIENDKGNEITENNKKESYTEIESTINTNDSSEIYYIKDGDSYKKYSGNISGGKTESGEVLYYKYTSYMPEEAGWYYVKATNAAGRGNSAEVNSEKWLINFAEAPNIEEDFEHYKIEDDSITLSPIITSNGGKTTYQWYKKVNESDKATILEGQTNETLTVNEEGYYSIKAINERNKDIKETISEDMRVTYPASDFTLTYRYGDQEATGATFDPDSILPLSVEIDFANPERTDSYTIEWFEKLSKTEATSLGLGETCTPNHTGTYYAKVINQYNKDTSVLNESPELTTALFVLSI